MDKIKIIALVLKWIILILAILIFLFALFSGAEDGGIKGIIRNSPNALPWIILFVFVFILWKRELVGGILLSLFGIFTIFMFDVFEDNIGVFFIISLLLLLTGVFFIYYSFRIRKEPE